MGAHTVSDGSAISAPLKTQLVGKWLRFSAWVSFILNVLIIGTGGAVRLTGSGLGCPTWPLCTAGSLVPTQELSYHSLIEFGNRTISGPILIFAILTVVLSFRTARKDLRVLAAVVLGFVVAQAVIGGVVVWLHLNANLVGVHYVISVLLVCVAAAFLARMYASPGERVLAVPKPFMILTHVTTLFMAVTLIFGVLTTGAGPHSGDARIARDGIDATLMAHIHSWPGYILGVLTIILTVWAVVKQLAPAKWFVVLLVLELVQIAIGVYQAREGLPTIAVGFHMVLAGLAAAAMTVTVLRLKRTA